MKPNYYFSAFLILLTVSIIISASTWQKLEAKVLPIMVSSLVLILVIAQLVRDVHADKSAQTTKKKGLHDRVKSWQTFRKFGAAIGWIIGFLISIFLVGHMISIPVFALAYLKSRGRGWLISVIYTTIISAFVYGVFGLGLQLSFYEGLLFTL